MKKILAIAVATVISAPVMADMVLSGGARYSVTDADGDVATDGRVSLSVAGSAEGANGVTAGYKMSAQANMGTTSGLTIEDNYMSLGNADVAVKLGMFEMTKVFSSGADTFQPDAAGAAGYENSAVRGRDAANIEVSATAGAFDLSVGTRIDDAEQNAQIGAKTTMGTVSLGAVYEVANAGTDDGVVLTAGTSLEGVSLNASYGKKGDAKSTNVNAGYAGFGVAYQIDEDGTAANEEKSVYGTYTVSDVAGVAGASLIIGGGTSETDSANADKFGVRLNYAF